MHLAFKIAEVLSFSDSLNKLVFRSFLPLSFLSHFPPRLRYFCDFFSLSFFLQLNSHFVFIGGPPPVDERLLHHRHPRIHYGTGKDIRLPYHTFLL